jgi:transposase
MKSKKSSNKAVKAHHKTANKARKHAHKPTATSAARSVSAPAASPSVRPGNLPAAAPVQATPAPAQPSASAAATPAATLPFSKGNPDCIGVDVSKGKIHYAALDAVVFALACTPEGLETFIAKCRTLSNPFVICEATGGYERVLVAALFAADINVAIVPPKRSHDFANGGPKKGKSDPRDARMLARLGHESGAYAHRNGPAYIVKLRDLLTTRRHIVERLVQLQGLLETPLPETEKQLKKEKAWQQKQKDEIEAKIAAHIATTPALKADTTRLRTVCGLGPIFAQTLLAYVPEIREIRAKSLCSLVGVVPIPDDSGKRFPRAHIQGGRKPVRDVLRMGAISAIKHNPEMKRFYDQLRTRHKPFRVCVVAVMRKLLMLSHYLLTKPNFTLA